MAGQIEQMRSEAAGVELLDGLRRPAMKAHALRRTEACFDGVSDQGVDKPMLVWSRRAFDQPGPDGLV